MSPPRYSKAFFSYYDAATKLAKAVEADGLLVLLERTTDWARLKRKSANQTPVSYTHLTLPTTPYV